MAAPSVSPSKRIGKSPRDCFIACFDRSIAKRVVSLALFHVDVPFRYCKIVNYLLPCDKFSEKLVK